MLAIWTVIHVQIIKSFMSYGVTGDQNYPTTTFQMFPSLFYIKVSSVSSSHRTFSQLQSNTKQTPYLAQRLSCIFSEFMVVIVFACPSVFRFQNDKLYFALSHIVNPLHRHFRVFIF